MSLKSIDPKNNKLLMTFELASDEEINKALDLSYQCFIKMRNAGKQGI
jgi:hypothetical protein